MEILHGRVAGLDVHKNTVVACARIMTGKETSRECRTFATTTDGLLALRAWLSESRCTHAAMEATGVYWTPVWSILSAGDFELTVANAAHIKNVPGRKTDMNDAMWLADLLAFGLIKASFVPTEPMHELRSLTRTRKQLVREQTRHVQRIQKTLAEANIKLDSVISDIMGASGRRIIEAMIAGVRQPHKLADLAGKQIKATPKELYDALHGRLTDHHRFLLELHLRQWDGLDASIRTIDLEIDQRIGGIDEQRGAGEPPFRALIESAGKRKSSRLRKGAPWLKTMLVQCAWAAIRKKGSYYQAQFLRLRHRRGPQKAICAVAASILTAIYHMLKNGTEHHDLGANHFDHRSIEANAKSLVARLKKLGFTVQLQPTPQAA
jgi:transposase